MWPLCKRAVGVGVVILQVGTLGLWPVSSWAGGDEHKNACELEIECRGANPATFLAELCGPADTVVQEIRHDIRTTLAVYGNEFTCAPEFTCDPTVICPTPPPVPEQSLAALTGAIVEACGVRRCRTSTRGKRLKIICPGCAGLQTLP